MAAPQADPRAQLRMLLLVLEQLQIIRYTDVACITLGAWEQILAFQSEMQYIWTMPWSAVKGISFFIRYSFLPFMIITLYESNGILTHTDAFCQKWNGVNAFWTFFVYASMHWLILLRVYAYYGRNRKLFWVLSSLWMVAFCTTVVELIVALQGIIPTSHFEPTLKLCIAVYPNWLPAIHCAFLILEIPLLIMIIRKYLQDVQQTLHTAIINRFIHDGVIYFFIVFATIIWNVFFGLFAPPVYNLIPRHWSLAILTICSHRLVINLRRTGEKIHMPQGVQESSHPSLGKSGASSGKKRVIGSNSSQTLVAAINPPRIGFSGTTAGVTKGISFLELQSRATESTMSTNGGQQHTAEV